MWVSFPLSRRVRVIMPWFVAVPLIPVAAGLWVLGLTFDAIRWIWTRPKRRTRSSSSGEATVRITVRS